MSNYQQFVFKRYKFDKSKGRLDLFYGYDDELEFCETYNFNFPFVEYDEKALDRAIQILFFVAGVSYYKMYLAPSIRIDKGLVDKTLADFLGKTYSKGLGEFFYLNKLDPKTEVVFPANSEPLQPFEVKGLTGQLIGLGGGKDSLVSVELMKEQLKVATWSVGHRSQLEPLVESIGLTHLWIERAWDPQIKTLNEQGALNGHVPISAIFSCVGTIVAILSGYRDTVVSNENSANEPTLHYKGTAINHQYSKSIEYEKDFQSVLLHEFGDSLRYYSLLRPYSELRIGELFASFAFEKYEDVFSSCNRAYTKSQDHMFWCGECPKCAFVCLILAPFIDQKQLETIWGGKNLLLDPSLEQTYKQLLGIEGDKPLECVGEIKEARAAMRLAQAKYPKLAKFEFELPEDYDWRAMNPHSMPEDIYASVLR